MSRAPILHICNTFFENELESSQKKTLEIWMRSHPAVQKLQTLPLLYGEANTKVLISEPPTDPNSRLLHLKKEQIRPISGSVPPDPTDDVLDNSLDVERIESWGASLAIKDWAEKRKIPYLIPDWEVTRTINSKIFSFTRSPKLPFASLLNNEEEVELWIENTPGPKVLKTAFGTAGRGHFLIPGKGSLASFLKNEFNKKLPLIGEPWVERVLDFSTQWKDGVLLGATVFENHPNGRYRSTLAGSPSQIFGSHLWALEEHLVAAEPLIAEIGKLGFFGHLGIDAFIYKWEGRELLHPIVEINGRKTMSWVALQIQKTKHIGKICRFSFSMNEGISISTV